MCIEKDDGEVFAVLHNADKRSREKGSFEHMTHTIITVLFCQTC